MTYQKPYKKKRNNSQDMVVNLSGKSVTTETVAIQHYSYTLFYKSRYSWEYLEFHGTLRASNRFTFSIKALYNRCRIGITNL